MKVCITTDFLMTNEKEQVSNLKWMVDILLRPLNKYNVERLVLPDQNGSFNRKDFFEKSNIKLDSKDVQFFFDFNNLTNSSVEYVRGFLNYDLVIGYELSEQTRRVFEYLDIMYIDIWLYPIRYFDDVLFGFRSNDLEIQKRLSFFEIESELFYIYADMLKIQNYRGFRRFKNQLIPNSALFIGQTLKDKAIFSNGSMLSVLDFKDEFKKYTQEYNRIYYSRHPFIKDGDEAIIQYLSRFSNVEVISSPTYHLLASEEIEAVFSVSSSVVHEAHFFGKKTQFLYKPIFETFSNTDSIDDNEKYFPIMHAFLFKSFWESIIEGKSYPKNNSSFYLRKDFFRDTLSFYWGYRDIDKLESLKQTVSHLYKKVHLKKD